MVVAPELSNTFPTESRGVPRLSVFVSPGILTNRAAFAILKRQVKSRPASGQVARGRHDSIKISETHFGLTTECGKPKPFGKPNENGYAFFHNTERYRSGHNEAVLKNSRYCHCKIVKTLDFIGVFVGSSARCEKRFSQFSRKFLAGFSQFPNVFEPILNWFGDYLGQFNSLRRHIEAVITRLS